MGKSNLWNWKIRNYLYIFRASFRIFTGRVHHIKGSVFRTGAPCIGKCFQDGCTPKLTGARAPSAPVLTEALWWSCGMFAWLSLIKECVAEAEPSCPSSLLSYCTLCSVSPIRKGNTYWQFRSFKLTCIMKFLNNVLGMSNITLVHSFVNMQTFWNFWQVIPW